MFRICWNELVLLFPNLKEIRISIKYFDEGIYNDFITENQAKIRNDPYQNLKKFKLRKIYLISGNNSSDVVLKPQKSIKSKNEIKKKSKHNLLNLDLYLNTNLEPIHQQEGSNSDLNQYIQLVSISTKDIMTIDLSKEKWKLLSEYNKKIWLNYIDCIKKSGNKKIIGNENNDFIKMVNLCENIETVILGNLSKKLQQSIYIKNIICFQYILNIFPNCRTIYLESVVLNELVLLRFTKFIENNTSNDMKLNEVVFNQYTTYKDKKILNKLWKKYKWIYYEETKRLIKIEGEQNL